MPKGVEAVVVAKDDKKIRMPTNVVLLKPFSGIATNRCFATEYIVCDGCRKVGYGKATRIDTGNDGEFRFSELDVRIMGFSMRGVKCEPGFPWCFHGTKIVCVDGEFVTERRK